MTRRMWTSYQAPLVEDPDDCLMGRHLDPGLHRLDCDYHLCYVESHHDHEGV